MTRLFNDPARFSDEAIDGFAAAHPRWVRRVPGGVVRRRPPRAGEVAVVIGGGAGHYPAFAGLVGEGLAAAAVVGNVFASPVVYGGSAGPGLLPRLDGGVDGLFLGRRAHDPEALAAVLDEALTLTHKTVVAQ